ncbi:MAG: DUF1800 domain-containing protein [Acidimicrobiales bacterium]
MTSRLAAAGPLRASGNPLATSRGRAAHLLRRAWMGYTEAQLDAAAAMSYPALVEAILGERTDESGPPSASDKLNPSNVVSWWWGQLAQSPTQFPERMALFWHGVLTSSSRVNQHDYVWQQLDLYRRLGRGSLRTLLLETTVDPLMMAYLNLGQSTAGKPNENYARELMELFTLGPGNYGEQDVRASARALSGYVVRLFDAAGGTMYEPRSVAGNSMAFDSVAIAAGSYWKGTLDAHRHDGGVKTFLGRTGPLALSDVIDAILAQEVCARFVTRKAMTFFGVPDPSADTVAALARSFRDANYDITTLLRGIFLSPDFTDPGNYRSLVRSPVDLAAAALRAIGHPELAHRLVSLGLMEAMGQQLYAPPNVAGWPGGRAWINSGAMLARINFADYVVAAVASGLPDAAHAVATQLDGVLGPDTGRAFDAARTEVDRWYILLACPEFQVK